MMRAVRIEPRVQLECALRRLGHREFERIVPRIRCLAHLTSQVFRPRLIGRRVQRVGSRTHLQDDRIQPESNCPIENSQQLVFLFLRRKSGLRGPVDVLDRCHPYTSEFASNWRRLGEVLYGSYLRLSASRVKTGEHEKRKEQHADLGFGHRTTM